jgi:phosphohistidine phosphatase
MKRGKMPAMRLLVVRHAIAAELEPGKDDALRPLTRKGVRRFRRVVHGLDSLGVRLAAVLHSPWTRASDTAALLAPLLGPAAATVATDHLCRAPEGALLEAIAAATPPRPVGATAVVGHEPFLGELIGWLTGGDPRHGEALLLKKGSVTWLEGSPVPGGMTLHAVLPPRVLRALAGR